MFISVYRQGVILETGTLFFSPIDPVIFCFNTSHNITEFVLSSQDNQF